MQNISSLISLPVDGTAANAVAGAKNGLAEGLPGATQQGSGSFTNILSGFIETDDASVQQAIAQSADLVANLVLQNLPDNGNPVPDSALAINDLKAALAELMESLTGIKGENLSPEQKTVADRLMAQLREIEQLVEETNGIGIQLPAWLVNDVLNNVQTLEEAGVISPQLQGIARQVNTPPVLAVNADDGQSAGSADDTTTPASISGETKFNRLENIIQNLVAVPQQNTSVKSEQVISDLLKGFQPSLETKSGDVLIGSTASLPSQISAPAGDRAMASLTVNSAFNQPGWGEEVGQRIRWLVNHNVQTAELRMNPPHLGPIEIRVSVQNDQMNVMFTSHHAAVREALEAAVPRLREMFGNSGLELANVDISQHSFSDQRRASTDGDGIHHYGTSAEEGEDLSEISEIQQRIYVSQGLVDFYA